MHEYILMIVLPLFLNKTLLRQIHKLTLFAKRSFFGLMLVLSCYFLNNFYA